MLAAERDAGDLDAEDAGVEDASVPDVGCLAREDPPFPVSWPFPMTSEAYQTVFWTQLPNREATCSLDGCHGSVVGNPPLITRDIGYLGDPAHLASAVSELWARCLPVSRGDAGAVAELAWHHRDAGVGATYTFSSTQAVFLEQFLAVGARCRWAPAFAREAKLGPPCDDAGVCACPLPAVDISACAIPDAG